MINIIEYAIYRDFFHRIFQAMFFFKTKSPQCGEKNKHGNDIADRKHTTVCNQFLCRTEQLYIGWFIWAKAKISKNHVYLPGRYYRIHRSCPYINGIAALAGTKLQTFKTSCEITYLRNPKDIYTIYHTEAEQLHPPLLTKQQRQGQRLRQAVGGVGSPAVGICWSSSRLFWPNKMLLCWEVGAGENQPLFSSLLRVVAAHHNHNHNFFSSIFSWLP